MEDEKKSGRGGAREGAGRPRSNDGYNAKRSLYCNPEELSILRAALREYRAGNLDATIADCMRKQASEFTERREKSAEGRKRYLAGLRKKEEQEGLDFSGR